MTDQKIPSMEEGTEEMSTSTCEAQGRIWGVSTAVVKKERRNQRVARRL